MDRGVEDAEGNFGSDMSEFEFASRQKSGAEIKFEVNLLDMTITNLKTDTKSVLYRKEMRVLAVKDMLADGSTAGIDAFQKDDVWKMQWQVEDNWGWKNMTEDSNQALLTEIAAQNANVELSHEWQHPKTKKWNDVDLKLEQQTSREWHKTQRAVRLVAMREWNRHN